MSFSTVRKAAVALAGIVAVIASTGLLHGTAQEVATAALGVATVLGVYHVPNADV